MGRPSPPTAVQVNGIADAGVGIVTKSTSGQVTVSAVCDDPDAGQLVHLVCDISPNSNMSGARRFNSVFGAQATRRSIVVKGLSKNTTYYGRCWTQAHDGQFSTSYNSFGFYTDRYPGAPVLVTPADNATFDPTTSIAMDWQAVDPDETADPVPSTGWQIQYRVAGGPTVPPGAWVTKQGLDAHTSFAWPANTFKTGTVYEWHVRTRDPQLQWGAWSLVRSFVTVGPTRVPVPVSPAGNVVIAVDNDVTLTWQFRDPTPGASQGNANLRYRVVGTTTWITVFGSSLTAQSWTFNPGTFLPGFRYEWQVQTVRASGLNPLSDWSSSATFWSILTPGSLAESIALVGEGVRGQLGCGHHRAFIFDRGGLVERGEITKFSSIQWGRLRDDISQASITIDNYGSDLGDFLGTLRSWRHELVVYRDDERVWEGPLTLRTMKRGQVVLGAGDVMTYVYRRVLRQGYNDSYHVVAGVQQGIRSVVERAGLITVNCLGYADPNVLPYLTVIQTGDDAQESRIVPDYSKTAWQDIDDMAANAGLDYTVVGRRIIYWDTHTQIGQLPELRDGDFSEQPIVTEYGMRMANFFAVTDGNGAFGAAFPAGKTFDDWDDYYGPVEQLATGYGDTSVPDAAATPEALAALQAQLKSQAVRNINGRWPSPMVVRVPDNATLMPNTNLTINQLVPGVWIPVRVKDTVQPFAQMQKLDSLTVTEDKDGEKVAVVMSPAPIGSDDPDATGATDGGEVIDG